MRFADKSNEPGGREPRRPPQMEIFQDRSFGRRGYQPRAVRGERTPRRKGTRRSDPKEGSDIVSHKGDWIANCLPDRVERISAASVYLLRVGPPKPNQLQNMDDLVEQGMVGLYRLKKKADDDVRKGQAHYLESSPFAPSPSALKGFLGPMSGSNS